MEEKLVACLREALESPDQVISISDRFREYPRWDSLAQLSLIASLDAAFEVEIEAEDFRKLETVQDLLNEIARRTAK